MDANAYLVSQGWLGYGYSLDASGKGLRKPISVQKKTDVRGVGKRKHEALTGEWWAKAFDDVLESFNDSTEKLKPPLSGAASSKRERVVTTNGLYSTFVKGKGLQGTLEPNNKNDRDAKHGHGTISMSLPKQDYSESSGGDESPRKRRKKSNEAGRHVEVKAS